MMKFSTQYLAATALMTDEMNGCMNATKEKECA